MLRFYYQYLNDHQTLSIREKEFTADNSNIEQDSKQIGRKYLKNSREIEELRKNILRNYQEATPLIKATLLDSQKVDFKIWKNMNPYSTETNDLNSLNNQSNHLKNIFSLELESIKNQDSFQDASVLERLIVALKEFENSPLMIPKLKVSIGELIDLLKEDNEKNFMVMSTYRNIQSIDNLLRDIAEDTTSLLMKIEETKEISVDRKKTSEAITTLFSRKNELKIMRETLSNYQRKIDYYLDNVLQKVLTKQN
jgi:hypothetical protein